MQLVAVYVLVGLAAVYAARATWRAWAGANGGCGSGCGQCAAPAETKTEGRFPLPQI